MHMYDRQLETKVGIVTDPDNRDPRHRLLAPISPPPPLVSARFVLGLSPPPNILPEYCPYITSQIA